MFLPLCDDIDRAAGNTDADLGLNSFEQKENRFSGFDHFAFVNLQWTALAVPTLLLAALFLAFQFFGDGLQDAMNPRTEKALGS